MAPKSLLFLAVSIAVVAICWCYPSGAPQETCKIFTANHTGHSAQNGRSKYDIKINPSSISSGSKATVTIQGDSFKGFFIQAHDESTKKPIGQFKSKAGVAQTRHCGGPGSSTAATHVNANDKTTINLDWVAPASFKGQVVFKAVIVKTYEIFWDNVQSKQVSIV